MMMIDSLKSLGYDITVKEGNVKLSYMGAGEPDKDKASPLIEELRVRKVEVIKELQKRDLVPISDDTLADLFLTLVQELQDIYGEGAITHPKIDEAEEMVNVAWAQCVQGAVSLSHFKDALVSFRKTYAEISERRDKSESLIVEEAENNLCRKCLTNNWERLCWGTNSLGRKGISKFCIECAPYPELEKSELTLKF